MQTLASFYGSYLKELDNFYALAGLEPSDDRIFVSLINSTNTTIGGLPAPDYISEWFKRFLKKYGLRQITFHGLRHSSVSYMLHRGIAPFIVSKIAGHSSLEQIQRTYGHAYDDNKKEAAEVFGSFLEPKIVVLGGYDNDGEALTKLHDDINKAFDAINGDNFNALKGFKGNEKLSKKFKTRR